MLRSRQLPALRHRKEQLMIRCRWLEMQRFSRKTPPQMAQPPLRAGAVAGQHAAAGQHAVVGQYAAAGHHAVAGLVLKWHLWTPGWQP